MKILKSWLNDWIDIETISTDDISEALESLGFEIESRTDKTPNYKNITVGKVLEIYEHPNADKVRVTKVDVGSKTYEIVCGAWNFDVGAVVPVALPKSEIKDGFKIDKRDIRGVESNGMICSASELDLWDDHAGILKLSDETKLGSDFSKIYNSTDTLWEIGVTPNRGDCMSHLGIARELSNYFNLTLKENSQTLKSNIENVIKVNSGKIKACNSYQSIEIENFTLSDSNLNIRYRLSSIGVRVINNVVDYTNYADNDKPIALAGVMGGYDTEVTDTTTNLLIESAYFDKVSIMKTSRRLNLISDASIRFERGIDFNLQKQGLQRFVNLFENDQEINYSSIIDSSKNGISYDSISFDKNEIEQILGVELDDNFIKNTLIKLQIESEISDKKIKFKSPSWRYDLERPIDLIEELAKHYGFNNFESTLPIGNNLNSTGDYWDKRIYLSEKLSSTNFYEIQTLSFTDSLSNELFTPEKKSVSVINPIDQTQENLRTNLLTSLINTYKFNFESNGKSHRYYEINNIYDDSKHKKFKIIPNQEYSLGLLMPENETVEDRKGKTKSNNINTLANAIKNLFPSSELEHLTRPGFHKNYSYLIKLDNKILGFMGKLSYKIQSELELHDSLYIAQINTENFNFDQLKAFTYKPLSAYPFIKFDLSFSVPNDFQASDLINCIESILDENENNISIFDNFTNEKTRNLGIRIVTRSYEKTFTETESTEILEMIVKEAESKFKIKLNKKDENAT